MAVTPEASSSDKTRPRNRRLVDMPLAPEAEPDARDRRPQIVSGSITIAPQGHSTAQMPQPLQKS
jgi:hypothetical protein